MSGNLIEENRKKDWYNFGIARISRADCESWEPSAFFAHTYIPYTYLVSNINQIVSQKCCSYPAQRSKQLFCSAIIANTSRCGKMSMCKKPISNSLCPYQLHNQQYTSRMENFNCTFNYSIYGHNSKLPRNDWELKFFARGRTVRL